MCAYTNRKKKKEKKEWFIYIQNYSHQRLSTVKPKKWKRKKRPPLLYSNVM